MTEDIERTTTENAVSTTAVALGAVAGALVGAAVAYALARQKGAVKQVKPAQALKAGMLVLGTLRQLAALLEEEA